jgi:hypothetical protein
VLGDTWEAPFEKPVPGIVSFTVTPDTIQSNVPVLPPMTVDVGLDRPAPGGVIVDVSLSGNGLATVLIPRGQTTGSEQFTLNGPLPPGDIIINGHFANQFFAAMVHVA